MSLRNSIIDYICFKVNKDKDDVLRRCSKAKGYEDLRRIIIDEFQISEDELLLFFSKELKIPFLDIRRYKISYKNKELLSEEMAFRYKVVPICKIGGVLTLATSNPIDVFVYDDIKLATNIDSIDFVLARRKDIEKVLSMLYSNDTEDLVKDFSQSIDLDGTGSEIDISEKSLEKLISESERPLVVRAVDSIIYNALKKNASDIHLEPTEDGLEVKYRIDGVLYKEYIFPKRTKAAIIARLKVISSLDITEFRIPQDGRFKVKFEDRQIDFRVSSLPTYFGEKFVLRVLDKEGISVGLKNLGFSPQPLSLFEEALKSPFGIILVTGPTGSGKSTTLYSIITQLNTPERNIITIEDPVEYQIEGITQIQVKPEIGLNFSSGLRAVLRQSPDIILVGETRDAETADIAVKASLTGQLIFSTLHTNDSVGAIARLIDMGIDPFLLSSSLIATTAQRLIRKLCPKCKEEYSVDKNKLKELGLYEKDDNITIYRPKGCSYCNNRGYKGRVAILEVLLIDDRVKEMIVNRAPAEEIIQYVKEYKNFRTLREDGWYKCKEGITSLEEVLRVTAE